MTKIFWRSSMAGAELLLATGLWGLGFVAVIWSLNSWDAGHLLFIRLLMAAVLGLAICAAFAKPSCIEFLGLARLAFVPGLCVGAMLYVQTVGLRYTTATKSSFITILYVVLVPVFDSVLTRKKIPATLWMCVAVSLFGVWLIVDPGLQSGWNKGDLLTMVCAVIATVQILAIDRISGKIDKMFLFNSLQSLWGCLFAALVLPLDQGSMFPLVPPKFEAWIGLIILGVGCQLIAFYLQVRAQKDLSPTVSSLFFLLESPFALLFAFLLLQERLNIRQGWGAATVLLSALSATILESRRKKRRSAP